MAPAHSNPVNTGEEMDAIRHASGDGQPTASGQATTLCAAPGICILADTLSWFLPTRPTRTTTEAPNDECAPP